MIPSPVMLPGAPPFPEAEAVTTARRIALKIAGADLPILIDGEIGTGRRTLAAAVAGAKSEGKEVLTFSAFDGLPEKLRGRARGAGGPPVVVLHHLHALDDRAQAEVAGLVRDRRILLIATTKSKEKALVPEMTALDATRVTLPPLRERGEDAVAWAEFFLTRAAGDLGGPVPKVSAEARRGITVHPWPGNLSELESVIRRAVLLRKADLIEPADLGFPEKFVVQPINDAVEEFKIAYALRVLAHFEGNRTQAARALGIDPRTMFRYLEKKKGEGE